MWRAATQLLVRAVRGGRVDRRDPDEVAERRDERIVGRRPGRVVEPPDGAATTPVMRPSR